VAAQRVSGRKNDQALDIIDTRFFDELKWRVNFKRALLLKKRQTLSVPSSFSDFSI
jgi:hypothetical protein